MNKRRFTMIELWMCLFIVASFVALVLYQTNWKASNCGKHNYCKSYLKQIGTSVATYYADGVQPPVLPINYLAIVQKTDFNGEFEYLDVKCPGENELNYVWLNSGPVTFASKDILAGELVSGHKKFFPFYVYQDGHVE